MPAEWQAFLQQIDGVVLAVGVLYALANCFFGYKLMRLWISLAGFLVGLLLGFVGGLACHLGAGIALLIGVVLGVLVALIANKVYRAGVFLLCFVAVYGMLYTLIPLKWLGIVLGIAGGILAGILAAKFLRPMVILSTGIGYGMSAAQMLLSLFGVDRMPIVLLVGVVLAVAGVAVQLRTTVDPGGKAGV